MVDTRLDELVERWQQWQREGRAVSLEVLCRDCPELVEEMRRRIGELGNGPSSTSKPVSASPTRPGGERSPPAPLPGSQPIPKVPQVSLASGAEPIPGYKLVKLLGRGGFGEVWKAAGPENLEVAIKFLCLGRTADIEARFQEMLKGLEHTHLPKVYGCWHSPEYLIIVMELAERSLFDRWRECHEQGYPGIPWDELITYIPEAAEGIDHLNQQGVQHRDIKPQNLLVMHGHVKLADFGLAKAMAGAIVSHTGTMSPAYAAVEFFEGKTSQYSDQYSLAITYCQLRGGRVPFDGTIAKITFGHLTRPPDLSMLPAEEQPPVMRALAKNPAERWANCTDFVDALEACAAPTTKLVVPVWSELSPPPLPFTMPADSGPSTARQQAAEKPVAEVSSPSAAAPSAEAEPSAVPPSLVPVHRAVAGDEDDRTQAEPEPPPYKGAQAPPSVAAAAPAPTTEGPASSSAKAQSGPRSRLSSLDVELFATARVEVRSSSKTPAVSAGAPKQITNSIGMKLNFITPGEFLMGASEKEFDAGDDEKPQHLVRITKPFYLGVYAVTQAEYERMMGGNPSKFHPGEGGGPNHPVEKVTWDEAVEFCRRLSELAEEKEQRRVYRLPTEAEWEYACRAGTKTAFHNGPAISSLQANFQGKHPYGGAVDGPYLARTTPVGSFRPNNFGLYDMHGNVWEWSADYYSPTYYRESLVENPPGPNQGDLRIVRGGSWFDYGYHCRAADRSPIPPDARYKNIGFRVAMGSGTGKRKRGAS